MPKEEILICQKTINNILIDAGSMTYKDLVIKYGYTYSKILRICKKNNVRKKSCKSLVYIKKEKIKIFVVESRENWLI
jgi:hypothetical protein